MLYSRYLKEDDDMPNRTLCDVLEEMRKAGKTRNYSYLEGLIEETQMLANRMEAALWDQNDLKRMLNEKKELKEELKKLRVKKKSLKKDEKEDD